MPLARKGAQMVPHIQEQSTVSCTFKESLVDEPQGLMQSVLLDQS